ncbi:hypothetical protein HYH03_010477 [Edaphochlamys debaryana]|uniref:Uncharacterized protein n=1 Tax=Edaphochlamys debaryana TaxID=47281 RepID=A0A835Y4S8_9CHLO|nr:hypothetical protein HYH03_010477 [Edaphochlamys debaryana]|eukprot:KAG2491029.1 hypothetical protein HYH03_010477 [Edaphochlamys debaryana]
MELDVQAVQARLRAALADLPKVYVYISTPDTLPVCGLDGVRVQDQLFALRALGDEGLAEAWLRAVQCAQLAHDRLLSDLTAVDKHLTFWRRTLAAGGGWAHASFMLLARGPGAFAADVAAASRRLLRLAGLAEGGTAEGEGGSSATDLMQQRVLLLRELRSRLTVALAELTQAADHLRLDLSPSPPVPAHGHGSGAAWRLPSRGGFAAGGAAGAPGPGSGAERQLQAAEAAVRRAVRGMRAALEGLTGAAEAPQGPAGGPRSPPSLAAELGALLRLLALRPLAAHALGAEEAQGGAQGPLAAEGKPAQAPTQASAPAEAVAPASELVLSSGGGTARSALSAARRAAALSGPLAAVPAAAAMPSSLQRHWLRYAAAGAALAYGGWFLVRHSRLAGSDDLDRWLREAVAAVRSALATHVAAPLAAVSDELFTTFRQRPAIVSSADFESSRGSLARMLADFAADHPPGPGGAGAGAGAAGSGSGSPSALVPSDAPGSADPALAAGMGVVMRAYEEELRRPLRGLLAGDLARALLIQVQHVKVDGEAAMLRLDQILRANELTMSLLAALPALGASLAAAAGLARLLIPRAPDPRRAAVPARLAMAGLEVALEALRTAQAPADPLLSPEQAAAAAQALAEAEGEVAFRLARLYGELVALYARADRTSRFSDWRPLAEELLRLAAPGSAAERLAVHGRMVRTYSVFKT